ncbi:MAG TPA: 50S ribosomal protein L7 [Clostridiales bacterium]|jgi:ribosomal protein L7Ae-like RNA K-turn-binding protein|nr:50S ribosomal protein L7 [Clostridiales bacterium]
MSRALGILGLARKAGALEIGEESAGIAARSGKARALLTANNASENTLRRVYNFAAKYGLPHLALPFTKDELGKAVGVSSCAALAFMSAGLAASFAEKLEEEFPGRFTQPLELLRLKADRIEQRKKEARAHERNVRTGKRASSKRKGRKMNG